MVGILNPLDLELYRQQPWLLILVAFQLWMLIDAVRNEEWVWAIFIFLFPVLNAVLYFFLVYRARPRLVQGFELPGTQKRHRIKELEAQIHHLDKAHHHAQLGDIYFKEGKFGEAEKYYRAAIERDGNDLEFQAHLGRCLLRQARAEEAVPLLEAVVRNDPKHDYGQTLMAYAETLGRLGRVDEAVAAWKRVLEHHSYARARVQLSQLFIQRGEKDLARKELTELLADETHAAAFQRKQDRPWVKQARSLLQTLR